MTDTRLDVLCIGNAIVDVLSHCDLDFIDRMKLNKGTMTLIDAARAEELYDAMGPAVEASGGSCGNTIAGVASLGGKGAYIGKVGNDQLGGIFRHDMRATGVHFETPSATSTRLTTSMDLRYSGMRMCSSGVWSSAESPGPYARMGESQTGPTTFMSEVPLLTLKLGVPPAARMAARKARTSGVFFSAR